MWAAISLPRCLCLQGPMTPSQCDHPPHSPGLGTFLRCSPGESVPGLLLRDSAGVGAPHGSLLASHALCPEGTVGSALQVCCRQLMLCNKLFQSHGSQVWGYLGSPGSSHSGFLSWLQGAGPGLISKAFLLLVAGATWPPLALHGPSRVVPEGSQTPKCFTCLTHWSIV